MSAGAPAEKDGGEAIDPPKPTEDRAARPKRKGKTTDTAKATETKKKKAPAKRKPAAKKKDET